MDKVVYVCTGSCKAEITEERYNQGLKVCGTTDCSMKDHTFEKRFKCEKCGSIYGPEENHTC